MINNHIKQAEEKPKTYAEIYYEDPLARDIDLEAYNRKVEENYKKWPPIDNDKRSATMKPLEEIIDNFNSVDISSRKGSYPKNDD